jgi:hypothetical protein
MLDHKELLAVPLWVDLLGALAAEMTKDTKSLSREPQPPLSLIQQFLATPQGQGWLNTLGPALETWREKFLFKNLKTIADKAIQKKLDVYFIVGRDHVQSLVQMFPLINGVRKYGSLTVAGMLR